MTGRPARRGSIVVAVAVLLMLVACSEGPAPEDTPPPDAAPGLDLPGYEPPPAGFRSRPAGGGTAGKLPRGRVTLAFAGDMHFELHLAALLGRPPALGPITRTLGGADLTMVNLESAITTRGAPAAKELEDPSQRYHFRTSPAALDFLDAAGVDVVTMANNHGADYGRIGVDDTLAAIRTSPVPVVGIGRNRQEAFAPYKTSVRGTDIAFLAADGSTREGASTLWAAGPTTAGIAAARNGRPRALLAAVTAASREVDVVVVYMHWGAERQSCPTPLQATAAKALAAAGADIVVGAHAHVPLGSGWLGGTYVNYGLGNFLWYNNYRSESGVLQIRILDGRVVEDDWFPARIGSDGRPVPLTGAARDAAVRSWEQLRACTTLTARPSP